MASTWTEQDYAYAFARFRRELDELQDHNRRWLAEAQRERAEEVSAHRAGVRYLIQEAARVQQDLRALHDAVAGSGMAVPPQLVSKPPASMPEGRKLLRTQQEDSQDEEEGLGVNGTVGDGPRPEKRQALEPLGGASPPKTSRP